MTGRVAWPLTFKEGEGLLTLATAQRSPPARRAKPSPSKKH